MKEKRVKFLMEEQERIGTIVLTLLASGFSHVDTEISYCAMTITCFSHSDQEKLLAESILKGFCKKGEKVDMSDTSNQDGDTTIITLTHAIN